MIKKFFSFICSLMVSTASVSCEDSGILKMKCYLKEFALNRMIGSHQSSQDFLGLLNLKKYLVSLNQKNSDQQFEKAVWLTTVESLDWPKSKNSDEQKKELITILDNIKSYGIKRIYFQVRPRGDALYKSKQFPWSYWITGKFAKDPGYDPLEFFVGECKKRDLICEAWMNPFLLGEMKHYTVQNYLDSLPDSNPIKSNPQWIWKIRDDLYMLDISVPEVWKLVVDEAVYILSNYDVNGIHIDDYFYPYYNKNNRLDYDFEDYDKYKKNAEENNIVPMTLEDWRRNNCDEFVKLMYDKIKKANKTFSISPFGIWKNIDGVVGTQGFYDLYVDCLKWVKNNWTDYVVPQLYWNIGFSADFKSLISWWNDQVSGTDVKLYIGLAAYKVDKNSNIEAWRSWDEINRQINLSKSMKNVNGISFFRYQHLNEQMQK